LQSLKAGLNFHSYKFGEYHKNLTICMRHKATIENLIKFLAMALDHIHGLFGTFIDK